jgi:hypothetical protein
MIDLFKSNGNSPPERPAGGARSVQRADLRVENHGSIVILRGMTDAGYAWIEEHCSDGGYQPFGLGARLCEPRYAFDIVRGAVDDGLLVR